MQDFLASLMKTRNLMIAGGVLFGLGIAGVAALAVGGGHKVDRLMSEAAVPAFGARETKSTERAPNVKSDYHPQNDPSAVAPKTTASKNVGGSVALNTKNSGEAVDNPLDAIIYGDRSAPVALIEYGSFTCSHCAEFHEEMLPLLKSRYFDKGTVKLVFRPFFRNAFDIDAGLFIACLPPERRSAWVSLLFHQQEKWVAFGERDELAARQKTRDSLQAFGAQAGFSSAQFDQCLANTANKSWLQAEHDQALKDGLDATPTFMIGGKKYTGMSIDEFGKILEPLIAKAQGRN
jgi:protein-disulfide isomerase